MPSPVKSIRRTLISVGTAVAFFSSPIALAQSFDDVTIVSQPSKPFSDYSEIYIAPVDVAVSSKARSIQAIRRGNEIRPVSERDQAIKANDLYDDLVRRLSDDFEIVDQGGTGVLTIAATITELQSSRPTQEDFRTQIGLSAQSLYVGSAAATFTIMEGDTVLATISDQYSGNFNDGDPRVGIWSDVDRAFSRWARNLNRYLTRN